MVMMSAEDVHVAVFASELAYKIEEPNQDECASGYDWKCATPICVQCDATPCDQYSQGCSKQNMTASSNACHNKCLASIPILRPGSHNKRQPVCWNRRMQKRHDKAGNNQRG